MGCGKSSGVSDYTLRPSTFTAFGPFDSERIDHETGLRFVETFDVFLGNVDMASRSKAKKCFFVGSAGTTKEDKAYYIRTANSALPQEKAALKEIRFHSAPEVSMVQKVRDTDLQSGLPEYWPSLPGADVIEQLAADTQQPFFAFCGRTTAFIQKCGSALGDSLAEISITGTGFIGAVEREVGLKFGLPVDVCSNREVIYTRPEWVEYKVKVRGEDLEVKPADKVCSDDYSMSCLAFDLQRKESGSTHQISTKAGFDPLVAFSLGFACSGMEGCIPWMLEQAQTIQRSLPVRKKETPMETPKTTALPTPFDSQEPPAEIELGGIAINIEPEKDDFDIDINLENQGDDKKLDGEKAIQSELGTKGAEGDGWMQQEEVIWSMERQIEYKAAEVRRPTKEKKPSKEKVPKPKHINQPADQDEFYVLPEDPLAGHEAPQSGVKLNDIATAIEDLYGEFAFESRENDDNIDREKALDKSKPEVPKNKPEGATPPASPLAPKMGLKGNENGVATGAKKDGEGKGVFSKLKNKSMAWDDKSLWDVLCTQMKAGRKSIIGSNTDPATIDFAEKIQEQSGEQINFAQVGLGATCRKGLKPQIPNQDSWIVLKVFGEFSIYAVFDGHGLEGHNISNFVKDHLMKIIIGDKRFRTPDMPEMLKDAFRRLQQNIGTRDEQKTLSAKMSGTTATVAVHDHVTNKITVAHVADSTAVMGKSKRGFREDIEGIKLTRDHKPWLDEEKTRIERSGGEVRPRNRRVYVKDKPYPGLNMSRSLGDLLGHSVGVSCEAEVSEFEVSTEDQVLLVGSDGLWEFITPTEAVTMVLQYKPTESVAAAEALAQVARDRWIKVTTDEGKPCVDDITAIVIQLRHRTL